MTKEETNKVAKIEKSVRRKVLAHLRSIGINQRTKNNYLSKEQIRLMHKKQRVERAKSEVKFFNKYSGQLINCFAEGKEIDVSKISPQIVAVKPDTLYGNLFRMATLLWSVPVSRGFGRRLRFVVIDKNNNKLMGIFALGDPVFNLRVRDEWIGWNNKDREARLVNVMDAYVLGAVPPYSQLIGGKLIASLVASSEVSEKFEEKYSEKKGLISKRKKNAHLVLVTTTSALGRSSLYNRLKLINGLQYNKLGYTKGYGHFHIPDEIFNDLRKILKLNEHKYADGHQYGNGSNWKFRVVRQGLSYVGLNPEILKHGIKREVYGFPLARNWKSYLQGNESEAIMENYSVEEISNFCLNRWIKPRAERMKGYRNWNRQNIIDLIVENTNIK